MGKSSDPGGVVDLPAALETWLKRSAIVKAMSPDERALIRHLLSGIPDRQIAVALELSSAELRARVAKVCDGLGVKTREELMASIFTSALRDLAKANRRKA